MKLQENLLVFTHFSATAYLFQGIRKGSISGLSLQTVAAVAVCSVIVVVQNAYWPIANLIIRGKLQTLGAERYFHKCVEFVEMCMLLGCMRMLKMSNTKVKQSAGSSEEDDFGKAAARKLWHAMFGHGKAPPARLHYALAYAVAFALAFAMSLATCSFSLWSLLAWVKDRPTAIMAIMDNSLRGLALMPQLHLSRKAGVVAPGLAVWMAMMGVVNITEILDDGFQWSMLCYALGDAMSIALVSDFLYLFVRSRLRGQKAVPIEV